MEFSHYAAVPESVSKEIIAKNIGKSE
jgi:hypothetical protein